MVEFMALLRLPSEGISPAHRNPLFREQVMRANEFLCVVCGFQGRLGHALGGIDAAHIKWYQVGGPDVIANALALCALNPKRFDREVYTQTTRSRYGCPQTIVSRIARFGSCSSFWLLYFPMF